MTTRLMYYLNDVLKQIVSKLRPLSLHPYRHTPQSKAAGTPRFHMGKSKKRQFNCIVVLHCIDLADIISVQWSHPMYQFICECTFCNSLSAQVQLTFSIPAHTLYLVQQFEAIPFGSDRSLLLGKVGKVQVFIQLCHCIFCILSIATFA